MHRCGGQALGEFAQEQARLNPLSGPNLSPYLG